MFGASLSAVQINEYVCAVSTEENVEVLFFLITSFVKLTKLLGFQAE